MDRRQFLLTIGAAAGLGAHDLGSQFPGYTPAPLGLFPASVRTSPLAGA
jgi:hypothetical protein